MSAAPDKQPGQPDTVARLKRALLAIERLQEKVDRLEHARSEPIAVVGIGCRFPGGANDPESFWRLLRDGVDAVREVPPDRWDVDAYYDPDPDAAGRMYTRYGGFLDRVDTFDAQFFGISPREATSLDPQQRLLLEVTWEALEHAGIAPDGLAESRTGVWIGILANDYYHLQMEAGDSCIDAYTGTGNTASVAAGRISYVLGLQGPNMAIDTACSSSLVAVHLACQSLRSGESDLALAGGVNLILSPDRTIYFCRLHAMAADGRCKAFDAAADGYVRGEGCGIVVLKRLSDALRDDDRVLAVIRGTAINQDGRSNGLTAPNGQAQEAVIRRALADARIAPAEVGYVEAHGTGTALGDPIEVRALATALGEGRAAGETFALGSVKTNFGHLEGAAGVAALIKVVLMLQHGAVPPHLHFHSPSPHIVWDEIPVVVPTELGPWTAADGQSRVAGVNSFGLSGTNAHVILAEAPARPARPAAATERPYLLPLSARNRPALETLARRYADVLSHAAAGAALPGDLCSTAAVRRSHFGHRLAVAGYSAGELREELEAFLARGAGRRSAHAVAVRGRRRKIVFVFPGQGSQWDGMARGLLHGEPVFCEALEQCDRAIGPYTGRSLVQDLDAGDMLPWIERIELVQPALFALAAGLAALWQSWGIVPDAVTGLSMGEVAAAYVAGALRLEDAARIICLRSRLLAGVSGRGAMAVVELSQTDAATAIAPFADRVSIAISNSPRSTVLSGEPDALLHILDMLERQGIFCRRVKVDVASHSPQMDALRLPLLDVLDRVAPGAGTVPLYSTVTAAIIEGNELGATYWARNLREPVRFAQTVEVLVAAGHDIFLEISPHPVVLAAIEDTLGGLGADAIALPSLRREDEYGTLARSLSGLYVAGCRIDWRMVYPSGRHSALAPTYPWQRERFWIQNTLPPRTEPETRGVVHPLLGRRLPSPLEQTTFETRLRPDEPTYLTDHRVHGVVVVPGAWHAALALAAGEALGSHAGACVLEEVYLPQALVLPESHERTVQTIVSPGEAGRWSYRLFSTGPTDGRHTETWTLHSTGTILIGQPVGGPANGQVSGLEAIRGRCDEQLPGSLFYERLRARHYQLGPTFQTVRDVWRRDGEALCRLELPDATADPHLARILMIDCCLQLPAAIFAADALDATYVPVGFDRFQADDISSARWAHAAFARRAPGSHTDPPGEERPVDIRLMNDEGRIVAEMIGLQSRRVDGMVLRAEATGESPFTGDESPAYRAAPERPLGQSGLAVQSAWAERHFEIQWRPRPLAGRAPRLKTQDGAWKATRAPELIASGNCLIFADEGGIGVALAALLGTSGMSSIIVRHGAEFEHTENGDWTIDPARPEHFHSLLREAFGDASAACQEIVHLWSLDAATPEATGDETIAEAQRLGCFSVVHLLQALPEVEWRESPRLWLVTRGAETGAAPVEYPAQSPAAGASQVAQATLCGLGRTIAYEHPELRCARVDLDPAGSSGEARELWEELVADDTEDSIALRSGRRLVARLARCAPASRVAAPPLTFRSDATYLITGGLGALGLLVAHWMAERGARQLVLAGRSEPSPAAQAQLETIREASGVEVVVARTDVSRRDEVTDLLERIERDMAPLRGIIHAAGILDDGILLQMTSGDFERVMAPKVLGAWHLHTLTAGLPLDHFVLFSSASAMIGSPGQGNYAAANAFLDALAHHRQALGLSALSINWGPWAGVGLAAQANRGQRLASSGIAAVAPQQGLQALEELLRPAPRSDGIRPRAQAGVMSFDLEQWCRFYPQAASMSLLADLGPARDQPRPPEPQTDVRAALLSLPPGPRRRAWLEALLGEQIARVLRLDPAKIERQLPLAELGFDSLMALELRNNLEAATRVRLSATLIWRYPTLGALASHLAEKLEIDLEAVSPSGATVPETDRDEDDLARTAAEIATLSDEQMAELLTQKIARMDWTRI